MAGLSPALIDTLVALADRLTADVQVSIEHEAFLERDKNNQPTYAAAVTRAALVEQNTRAIRNAVGEQVIVTGPITFPRKVIIGTEDRLTLPGGQVVTVAHVKTILKPAGGGYLTQVWLTGATYAD